MDDPYVLKLPKELTAEELVEFKENPGAWYDEQFAELRLRDPVVATCFKLQEMQGISNEDMFKMMAYTFIVHAVSLRDQMTKMTQNAPAPTIIIPGR